MPDRVPARGFRPVLLALALSPVAVQLFASAPARAQGAVAFQPGVSTFPNGVIFPVTPVVSDDRRYVRLTLSPQFTSLEGFDPFLVPAAVAGTGGGGIGGGGGGGGRGAGGGGGGARLAAGMGGVISPDSPAPMLAAVAPLVPGFASPDAVALLSGTAGPVAPAKLSASMVGDIPSPRAKPSRVRKPTRLSKRR